MNTRTPFSQQAVTAVAILLAALTTIGGGLLLAVSDNPAAVAESATATRFLIPTVGPSATAVRAAPSDVPTAIIATNDVSLSPSFTPSPPAPSPTVTPTATATPHPTRRPTLYISPTLEIFVVTTGPGPTQTTTTTDGACSYPTSTITMPRPSDVVSGVVTISGSATYPDFAYYKFELRPKEGSAADYVTIFTGYTPVENGDLMTLNTRTFANGPYWLRLVVTDSTGNYPERCAIALTINN